MKQLLQALTSDAPWSASRPVPSSYAPGAGARLLVGPAVRLRGMAPATKGTTGRFANHHGANRLMVIPTDAHRRPPETPT